MSKHARTSSTSSKRHTARGGGGRGARPGHRPGPRAAASQPEKGPARLQKVLAAAGVASRRQCEQLILEGRVDVDGQTVTELGTRVDPGAQQIRVDGEQVCAGRRVYFVVNKPPGVVSTLRDPEGRPRVVDLVPETAGHIFNVGRLDVSSEGLILVTNDGELAERLTHPRHCVAKTYHVTAAGHVGPRVLQQLRQGVHLAEGMARVVSVRVHKRHKKSTVLQIVLDEGRNRQIRRLLAGVGHKVVRLVRVAIGPLKLAELPRGAFRKLTVEEVRALYRATQQGSVSHSNPHTQRRRSLR